MSRVKRKSAFCICENKNANQLCGDHTSDQCFCFRYIDRTIPLLPKSLAIFCGSTARFVLDLVRTPEYRFSLDTAKIGLDKVPIT